MNIRRSIFIVIVIVLLVLIGLMIHRWVAGNHNQISVPAGVNATGAPGTPGTTLSGTGPVSIIISPDIGDAVFSLGGFLAGHDRPELVATFFTGAPATATTTSADALAGFTDSAAAMNVRILENQNALKSLGAVSQNYGYVPSQYGWTDTQDNLESEIAQDIQSILIANTGRKMYVYGPADFGTGLMAPDNQVVHDAFADVMNNYPATTTQFFYYESYPAIIQFNATSPLSLEKFLENESGGYLQESDVSLSGSQVSAKIAALKKYQSEIQSYAKNGQDIASQDQSFTENRCAGMACEATYLVQ